MEAAKKKLEQILVTMFQFDCADLDFGMYRVLNLRRAELTRFLREELLPQVETILRGAADDRPAVEAELKQLEAQMRQMGFPESGFATAPKWQELKARLDAAPDVGALAREVFSDLTTFFGRYYEDGDFLALPRYKGQTYAIPYDGEEVKLHWANADQYYIKSTETFGRYVAKLEPAGALKAPELELRVVSAEADRDNNKPAANQKRRFVLRAEEPVRIEGETLTAFFEYRADDQKQDARNEEAATRILAAASPDWQAALSRPAPQNKEKTALRYQIERYTRRQTSDYFIHKDLGGFLRRELDFFLKNEVLHLDDIEGRTTAEIDAALKKIKASRAVGHKIIDWLAQIEDFQKRLFLKKKLVLRTEWCVTLDRVPKALYPEIAANAAQVEAWDRLFAIRDIQGDLVRKSGKDVDVAFLEQNPYLLVDTRYFDGAFNRRLTAGVGASGWLTATGELLASENFQALSLLAANRRTIADCAFIDPPYNTGNDGFSYKDGYQHASWLSLLHDRLHLGRKLIHEGGACSVTIDRREDANLRLLMDVVFGSLNFVATIAWQKLYTVKNSARYLSEMWDSILVYALSKPEWRPLRLVRSSEQDEAYGNPDNDPNGPWISNALQARNYYSAGTYSIRTPGGRSIEGPPPGTYWRTSEENLWELHRKGRVWWGKDGNSLPRIKTFLKELKEGVVPSDYWLHQFAGTNAESKTETRDMLGSEVEGLTPKPVRLMRRIVEMTCPANGVVLDYFAGSGTTGHAILELNRADNGNRRFILIEMGEYFDTVLVPRILKATYSKEWKNGKPVDREGISACYKLLYLESYDDTLENLDLRREPEVDTLLSESKSLAEDYTLRYMLDLETKGSLLDLPRFRKPFDYRIKTRRGAEVVESPVDLVETFNYLLGLRVKSYDTYDLDGVLFVEGTDPQDAKVLVVWRDHDVVDNEKLNAIFRKAFASVRSSEFDVIYVNGDNHLPIVKTESDHWKVNLIEETFHDLMFDTRDAE